MSWFKGRDYKGRVRFCPRCGYDGRKFGGLTTIVVTGNEPKDVTTEACHKCGCWPMRVEINGTRRMLTANELDAQQKE